LHAVRDDAVVEHPAEAVLVGEVGIYVTVRGVATREHPAQRQERPRHPKSGIAEDPAERSESPERQARCRDERVGVETRTRTTLRKKHSGMLSRPSRSRCSR